jgi:pimeloyl-ACP methyl ester carboxylesterase
MHPLFIARLCFLAGKNWGPAEDIPVIALHGWRDNAGSFDPLVPLLNFNVFAFDLPGHGLSSHAPFGVHAHYTDGVVVLRAVVRHLGYKKVSFIGHSLGSSLAFTYAALFPDEVDKFVSIECGRARILIKPKELADNMGSTVDSLLNLDDKILNEEPPSYLWNELVERHQRGAFMSPTIKSCNILLKRGAKQSSTSPDKFQYTCDPRVRLDAFKRFSKETLLACASAIKCEVLNIYAKPGLNITSDDEYMQSVEAMKNSARKVEIHEVIGSHHVHMNNPDRIAPLINNFFHKN